VFSDQIAQRRGPEKNKWTKLSPARRGRVIMARAQSK
jgi:ribosomal protein L24E